MLARTLAVTVRRWPVMGTGTTLPCVAEKEHDFAQIAARRLEDAITQYAFTR
jgi:hypothetical protein